ncbi:NAD(P)/FAD-dependent oxidoreductase [Nonomuraea wenchangensis]|uniref:Glycine/D-amino acid oxidase n=1 Tax=Nonomuraea wenchangensis TaxID=568860 RepID=A0A1I0BT07_9ACTN|nr:FAD-dependent oxidoreductase [Nonomuraea wenchangensis]SET10175.1 Glycine/D-amino acid oxidase [Nonomuraea wenchangensis]
MRVVVIGAGVVGSAVAAGLTRRGARVTVLEARTPGSGTSATSMAWVNANNKRLEEYFRLNHAGVLAHHELPGPWFFPTGHLERATTDEHKELLDARVARLASLGYPVERVTEARAGDLEPDLVRPPGAEYAFFPGEGHVHPMRLIGRLLGEARDGGAAVECGAEVTAIEASASGVRVSVAGGRAFDGDAVVTCAGRWTQGVAALAGAYVPMLDPARSGRLTNGFLVTTAPVPARLSRMVTTSGVNLRPDGAGRLLLQALGLDDRADPATPVPADVRDTILARLPAALHATEGVTAERAVVGQRALPGDGLTVAGFADPAGRVYTVATHSGVTLAPLLGREVAGELYGEESALLAPFRPGRFTDGTAGPPPVPARRAGEQ